MRCLLICTPLVGRTREDVLGEIAAVLPKKPDVVEWRVDFFRDIDDTALVIDTARALKSAAGCVPVLFTRRSASEGGERVALSDTRIVELYEAVCAARCVELIDYELSNPAEAFERLRAVSRQNAIALVGSYHNFQSTPAPRGAGREIPRRAGARRGRRQGRRHADVAERRA